VKTNYFTKVKWELYTHFQGDLNKLLFLYKKRHDLTILKLKTPLNLFGKFLAIFTVHRSLDLLIFALVKQLHPPQNEITPDLALSFTLTAHKLWFLTADTLWFGDN